MVSNEPVFIEHYFDGDGNYVTDIWYSPKNCQYTSVISNLEPITFGTLEDIKKYLKGYKYEK